MLCCAHTIPLDLQLGNYRKLKIEQFQLIYGCLSIWQFHIFRPVI